ncbi:putative disease resistance protein RGA3 [Platanthera zijinensis]|uniref:Disease resistance protein RGA3 n=1 Tax=Platanthera zijinensis TaxID=2320716 RepID=A0AAP0B520_9ASPA
MDVVSIVGLGGLGKTALARIVYNDERVRGGFEKRMWVCVSDEFEIKRLIVLIMESVTGSQFCQTNMDMMQVSLAEQLKEKRFLLVFDDVWNESEEKWDKLRTLLAVGGKGRKGSKILVTRRTGRVASLMGTVSPYRLSNLSLNDCWLVFERRAFAMGVERNLNLVEIGREIVKKCGGVPLAVKALGSLLRFKKTESGWLAIKDSELEDVLPNLQAHHNLKELKIQCYVGRGFPHRIMNLSLSNLARLTLKCCMFAKLPALGQLPQLESLNLTELPLIKQVGCDFYGSPNSFLVLKELKLNDMAELEEWCNAGEEQFLPCLHKLTLCDCPKLKELPSDFPSVTILIMNGDDKLLLLSLQNGVFQNFEEMAFKNVNSINFHEEGKMPEIQRACTASLNCLSAKSKAPLGGTYFHRSSGYVRMNQTIIKV